MTSRRIIASRGNSVRGGTVLWALAAILSTSAFAQEAAKAAPEKPPIKLLAQIARRHVAPDGLLFEKPLGPDQGQRVELYLVAAESAPGMITLNQTLPIFVGGKTADEHLAAGDWAWHDFPSKETGATITLPPGAMTVVTFNTKSQAADQIAGSGITFDAADPKPDRVAPSKILISAATFTGTERDIRPDAMIIHVENTSAYPMRLESVHLWRPKPGLSQRVFFREPDFAFMRAFPTDGVIPPGEKGGFYVAVGRLTLGMAVVDVEGELVGEKPLRTFAHVRVKKETFDISAGIPGSIKGKPALVSEPYLKTLKLLHVNTVHAGKVSGYNDTTGADSLFAKYPLKSFDALSPPDAFDVDEILPRLHAADIVGDPQRKPASPMDVWKKLEPLRKTRLISSITLSDPRTWRLYSGIGDYPVLWAPRITLAGADLWKKYDRWKPKSLGWGAPLETIGVYGDLLRQNSAPRSMAAWAEGPFDGSETRDGRPRGAPTPDELRVQLYGVLSSRVSSIYWHDLTHGGLVKYRDLIEPMARLGREMRALSEFFADGDHYRRTQTKKADGTPDWELASVTAEQGAVLFAIDLDYVPDERKKNFVWKEPRAAKFEFDLPKYVKPVGDVFRVDGDGIYDVEWQASGRGVVINDKMSKAAIYIAAAEKTKRREVQDRLFRLNEAEGKLDFNPGASDEDFEILKKGSFTR